MKTLLTVSFATLSLVSAFAGEQKMPLDVKADANWEVKYEDEGVSFIVFSRPENEEVIFFFSRWPAPGGPDQIHEQVTKIADGLLETAKDNEEIKFTKPEYAVEDIKGIEFSGKAAIFDVKDGSVAVVFMVSCGDGIWNGQYHGPKELYIEAKAILKSMKKANKAEMATPRKPSD